MRNSLTRLSRTGVVVSLLLVAVLPSTANVQSLFTYGTEGWKVATTGGVVQDPVWHVDGYIYTGDPDGTTTYWMAPEKFRGQISWCYGYELIFDELVVPGQGSTPLDPSQTALVGMLGSNGVWLSYFSPVAPTSITTFAVPIKAGSQYGWRKGTANNDPYATYSDMIGVLQSASAIYLKAEYYAGAEVNYLDNVILTPEPSGALAVFCPVGGALAVRLVQRRRGRFVR